MLKKLQALLSAALVLAFLIPTGAAKAAVYLPPTFSKVAAGSYSVVALADDGQVWTWGDLLKNAPGNVPGSTRQTVPTQVYGLSSVTDISAMDNHVLALDASGQVWAWGYNGRGELGDGTTTQSLTPVQSLLPPTIVKIAAGGEHSLALDASGTVYAWGENTAGQTTGTNGTYIATPTPVSLTGGVTITDIAAGQSFSLALSSAGTVYAWGSGYQSLGGTLNNPISGMTGVTQIAAAQTHVLASTVTGAVYSWGTNYSGELGINNTNDTFINNSYSVQTVQVPSGVSVSKIAAGGRDNGALTSNSFIIDTNNQLWVWGDNSFYQLGTSLNGLTKTVPAAISSFGAGSPYTVRSVASGAQHMAVVLSDGSIKLAGSGMDGQLGQGTLFSTTGYFTSPSFANAALTSLQFYVPSQGSWVLPAIFNPAGFSFQSSASTYSINIPGNVWALGIAAQRSNNSILTINNQPPAFTTAIGGNQVAEVPLTVGNNVITLQVTSSLNPALVSTYTINVDRAPDAAPPSLVSAAVKNQPDTIALQYDEPITRDPMRSAAADFIVKAGTQTIAVQSVVYDVSDSHNTRLLLKLADNVPTGQPVTLSIAANAVQDSSANGNPQLTDIAVSPLDYPSIESAFASADGSKIYIRYDRPLQAIVQFSSYYDSTIFMYVTYQSYPDNYSISVYPDHDTAHARAVQSIDFANSSTVVLHMTDNVANANFLELYVSNGFVKAENNAASQGITGVTVANSAAAIAAMAQVDTNQDGVTVDEVVKATAQNMDVNQDGRFDQNDVFEMLTFIAAQTIPGSN